MDPIRVATVGVQADTLDSPILDEEISVGPVSPCHGSLVMDGCETAYLTDNSIEEEVVVVADNASDSLSAIESLDSPGSSSHEMAPSYFLASCGDEEKLTFSHQPTLFLAAQGENSILPLEPGVPLINFNETLSQPTTTSSSSDVNQNWFTTKEDKTNLHIKGAWDQQPSHGDLLDDQGGAQGLLPHCGQRLESTPVLCVPSCHPHVRQQEPHWQIQL